MIRIAVTGGIACGKSRVAAYLLECGIPVCEADTLAHAALALNGVVYCEVVNAFGAQILTDAAEIDRTKLGQLVFSDATQMAILNRLVHPVVKAEVDHWLRFRERETHPRVAVVIPLLFETEMVQGWDAVVCVGCSAEVQRFRLSARGFDAGESEYRIAAQMVLSEKMKRSDYVIWNDESVTALKQKVDDVLRLIEERNT